MAKTEIEGTTYGSMDELLEAEGKEKGWHRAAPAEPTKIEYRVGDASAPPKTGAERFIVHVCNDVGAWGAGFTRSLSQRSKTAETAYRRFIRETPAGKRLGCMELIKLSEGPEGLFCANMIAQRGLPSGASRVVIDYEKLEKCLVAVAKIAADWGASCHMPRIGCGIAGGDWHTVEAIIERTLCARGVAVFVYDLPRSNSDN